MKNFLTTIKGKVIAGVVTLAVVGAVIVAILVMNRGYRTIAVEVANGITKIVNAGNSSEAYVGLHLKSGDDVTVGNDADLTLAMDQDKHMYAEPNTHFWVEALGKIGDTRTTVKMDSGSNLFRIDNKLTDDEYFNVDTPNATMSVRGTVFRVTIDGDETILEVFEGEVYIERLDENGAKTGESRIVKAGECARVRTIKSGTEFVDGMEIDYHSISKKGAEYIGLCIDDGRVKVITKDLLYDYVGINEHVIQDADFVEATCSEEGHKITKCDVCGEILENEIIPVKEHSFGEGVISKEPTEDEDGEMVYTCEECGYEKIEKLEKIKEKTNNSETQKKQTKEETDSNNTKTDETKPSEPEKVNCNGHHNFVVTRTIESTCQNQGIEISTCSKCGELTQTIIPVSGHVIGSDGSCVYGCGYTETVASEPEPVNTDPCAGGHDMAYMQTPTGAPIQVCRRCGYTIQ